jgi:hypothetical protein
MADEPTVPPVTLTELLDQSQRVRENMRTALEQTRADEKALGETMERAVAMKRTPDVSLPDAVKAPE